MFYVAGKIADKSTPPAYGVVESGMRDPWDLDLFSSAIATNHGGVPGDYSFFTAADNSTEATRAMSGDLWVPTWTGNSITALDFSAYDALKWIRFYASKTNILANNRDLSIISAKVYVANKSEVDTTYSGTLDVTMRSPRGPMPMRFVFSKGLSSKNFKTNEYGEWSFPSNAKLIDDLKIDTDYIVTIKTII
jgi:hypothetical protein